MPSPNPTLAIQQAYDTADQGGAEQLADWLVRSFSSLRIHMMLLDRDLAPRLQAGTALDATPLGNFEDIVAYNTNWRARNPRFHAALQNPGEILSDVQVFEPRSFERSDFYNDFMRLIGQRYTLFTSTPQYGGENLALAIMRSGDLGAFRAEETQLLTQLTPHLGRMMRMSALLEEAQSHATSLEMAFDRLPVHAVLVDGAGTIAFLNTAARQLLAEGDAVKLQGQRLVATHPADDAVLRGTLSEVAQAADDDSRVRLGAPPARSLRLMRKDGSFAVVTLFPLRPSNQLRATSSRARVLCLLDDPTRRPRLDAQQLQGLFGLTLTESALANALLEGKSLAEFAAERGCSIETARTHMKRILSKSNTRSQADFIREVLVRLGLQVLA